MRQSAAPTSPAPPDFAPAPRHELVNALRGARGRDFQFGSHTFKLEKRGLKHILERHHPSFWDGSIKREQSFFDRSMSVDEVEEAIADVMRQNRSTLATRGTRGSYQVRGTHNGQDYVLGVNSGRIAQFYPPVE
jgi:hypothetical protein